MFEIKKIYKFMAMVIAIGIVCSAWSLAAAHPITQNTRAPAAAGIEPPSFELAPAKDGRSLEGWARPRRTPTPTPAISPTPRPVTLHLWAAPNFVPSSGKVNVFWRVEGWGRQPLDGLELLLIVPTGFRPLGSEPGRFDPATGTLRITPTRLHGKVLWQIDDGIRGPFTIRGRLLYANVTRAEAVLVLED